MLQLGDYKKVLHTFLTSVWLMPTFARLKKGTEESKQFYFLLGPLE